MEFDLAPAWWLLALPVAFALGWIGSRLDVRQWQREQRDARRAYDKGLNLLLSEQHDKAIDAFIAAVQRDPDSRSAPLLVEAGAPRPAERSA